MYHKSQQNGMPPTSKSLGGFPASMRRLRTKLSSKAKMKCQGDHSTATNKYPRLAPYATVSHRWQAAIERVLFAEVSITSDELQDFVIAFSSRSRRQRLQAVVYTILMPPEPRVARMTTEEYTKASASRSKTTSKSLLPLFAVLWSWDNGPSHLRLGAVAAVAPIEDLLTCNTYSISIDNIPLLPVVHCVRILSLYPVRSTAYNFSVHSHVQLASRFPNLQDAAWNIDYAPVAALDFYVRHLFTASLAKALKDRPIPKMSLGLSSMLFGLVLESNNCWIKEDYDPFLAKLRTAKANVSEFCYSGWVDESFFWPPGDYHDNENSNNGNNKYGGGSSGDDRGDERNQNSSLKVLPQPPVWHSLRHLTVCMSLFTPTGQWYFEYRRETDPFVSPRGYYFVQDINTPAYWPPSEESRISGANQSAILWIGTSFDPDEMRTGNDAMPTTRP